MQQYPSRRAAQVSAATPSDKQAPRALKGRKAQIAEGWCGSCLPGQNTYPPNIPSSFPLAYTSPNAQCDQDFDRYKAARRSSCENLPREDDHPLPELLT